MACWTLSTALTAIQQRGRPSSRRYRSPAGQPGCGNESGRFAAMASRLMRLFALSLAVGRSAEPTRSSARRFAWEATARPPRQERRHGCGDQRARRLRTSVGSRCTTPTGSARGRRRSPESRRVFDFTTRLEQMLHFPCRVPPSVGAWLTTAAPPPRAAARASEQTGHRRPAGHQCLRVAGRSDRRRWADRRAAPDA